jgi:hypothetical protein
VYKSENRSEKKVKIMSNGANIANGQEILERLSRQGSVGTDETSVVTSPGARAAAWAVKVKSLSSYNVYNVRAVVIGVPGSLPVEIGGQIEAVNMAESFLVDGQLSAGTYAIMSRVGDRNVFYVPV